MSEARAKTQRREGMVNSEAKKPGRGIRALFFRGFVDSELIHQLASPAGAHFAATNTRLRLRANVCPVDQLRPENVCNVLRYKPPEVWQRRFVT
jgi:hypothetical protein